jgi:hypothetical protein
MLIMTRTEEPKPRYWPLILGIPPTVLVLAIAAFLTWLPSQGQDGAKIGSVKLWAGGRTDADTIGIPNGVTTSRVEQGGMLDTITLRMGPYSYSLYWLHQ